MIRKIFIGVFTFLILLVAALAILPFVFKDKIIATARQEINKQLNAQVNWSDIGVSAFKDFPNISLFMKKLVVINAAPFKGDTLLRMDELVVSINPMKLLNGKHIEVADIKMVEPCVHVHIMKDGTANYNIMKTDTSATASSAPGTGRSYQVSLKKFLIKNGHIIYDDKEEGFYTELTGFNYRLSGNFGANEFEMKDNATAKTFTVREGNMTYLKQVKLETKSSVEVSLAKNLYRLKEYSVQLNDLLLNLSGSVMMPDTGAYTLDLNFKAKEPDFKHLISLLPAVYSEDFAKVRTTGGLTLEGYARGKYDGTVYPAFGVALKVNNGTFQYPGLPAAVTAINIDIKAKSRGGSLDNTVVDIDTCSMNLAGDPFNMKLHVTSPVLDPSIDGALSSKIDLSHVKNYYPMKDEELQGMVDVDVSARGRLSDIEKEQYDHFSASGTVLVTGVKYINKQITKPVKLNELRMTLHPEQVSLDRFSAEIGHSDITATGELDNLLNYMFSKATLKGNLKIRSDVLDLNELLAEETTGTPAQSAAVAKTATPVPVISTPPKPSSSVAQVPPRIDFVLDAFFDKLYYTNIILDSVNGEVDVRNETVTLNNLQGNVFDGTLSLNGDYSTLMTETPKVDMEMKMDMITVEKAVNGFANMLSSVPVARAMKGALSTVFNVKTELDKEMNPNLKTMTADGRIDVHHLEFNNKGTESLAQKTKLGVFKLVHFKDFVTTVKVAKGKLYVEPFHIKMDQIDLTVYGSHDISDSTSSDYSMLIDAPADSTAGAKGKRAKYKVGFHGKNSEPDVYGAQSEDDSVLQTADVEQQNLRDSASTAKQEGETQFTAEKEKRQRSAELKAQKKAEKKQKQAEQKAKEQG